jgi:hypothetical protein
MQSLLEFTHVGFHVRVPDIRGGYDANTPNSLGLLSACGERPHEQCAAEKPDELPAPDNHSITSSARPISVGGTV